MGIVNEGIKEKAYSYIKGNPYTYALAKKIKPYIKSAYVKMTQDDCGTVQVEPERIEVRETVTFSILIPLYNTEKKFLVELIESVLNQSYRKWELCLADGSDLEHGYVEKICKEYQGRDSRIKYKRLEENKGISSNTNQCAEMASGEYLVFADHDDLIDENALAYNALYIEKNDADVLYSDEDHITETGENKLPFYKPDWSPDLLYSQMYICHLLVVRKELFDKLGGLRSACDGAQDYDLMLRLSLETSKISHIPHILYHWREASNSTAANSEAKPYAHEAGRKALDDFLKTKYGKAAKAVNGEYTFCYEARFGLFEGKKASIIIPMKDKYELTDACVKSIIKKSSYSNYEVIIIDNNSVEEQTKQWFKEIVELDNRISVVKYSAEFNWSKINNYGVTKATGDVFVFLNNDTLIISSDWLERLMDNALRQDAGVVGGLLLYQDETIQHAGVIVGMNGWADHVFKAEEPIHQMGPYVSPVLNRNVLAVTGACMAVSRDTWDDIGKFDEEFIICGSDVELGLRAYRKGYVNVYNAQVKLYHLESKSRDSFIPEIDFKKSREAYYYFLQKGDPYFNANLSLQSTSPKVKEMPKPAKESIVHRIKGKVKKFIAPTLNMALTRDYRIPEVMEVSGRKTDRQTSLRLNLLVPSLDKQHVFGGISTALRFFYALQKRIDCGARIIILDAPYNESTSVDTGEYLCVSSEDDFDFKFQIVPFADRFNKSIPVGPKDVFIATGWWTAYNVKSLLKWQADTYKQNINPLLYLIQDYEPGFYAWSSRHALADSTYRMDLPVYAVINSSLLRDFFKLRGYEFTKEWYFEPHINKSLAEFLPKDGSKCHKKKQILIYGRPSVERNAFEIIVEALKIWASKCDNVAEWQILSAGEDFSDIQLGNGAVLHSVGKLSLADYAQMMLDTYAGISLMVSPHPSYPPLEMSTFGVKVITNKYANKDLGAFNDNMISVDSVASNDIAEMLYNITSDFAGLGTIRHNEKYVVDSDEFGDITGDIFSSLNDLGGCR